MNVKLEQSRLSLPNLLTGFRFVAAPILLWLAWNGRGLAFMILLAVAFLTDVLDGFIARWTRQVTEFGARLDSWADLVNYLTISVGCWWLWPETVRREAVYVTFVIVSFLLPPIVGFSKFGRLTSYHTWAVKVAAASMGVTLYVLFLGGPAWPFRLASIVCLLAAVEEISITLYLSEPKTNVRSFWHLLKKDPGP
ncbi:MAG: CDP-alcohol phosphatidyltransferase family protein [Gammaproteobacteria bacterium]